MIGSTLRESRRRIQSLAIDDGSYYIVCARTGKRPLPVAGKRFDSRGAATAALRAAERYRRTLRRHDPQLPMYELIVCEDEPPDGTTSAETPGEKRGSMARDASSAGRQPADGAAAGAVTSVWTSQDRLASFCHNIMTSVLAALADVSGGSTELVRDVVGPEERRKMTRSPGHCLSALERLAAVLERRLASSQRADLLATAARRRSAVHDCPQPLEATLSRLESVGLITGATVRPRATDRDGRSWLLTLQNYGLRRADGPAVTLPLTAELFAHRSDTDVSVQALSSDSSGTATGEQLVVTIGATTAPSGLVHAEEPVQP